MNGPTMNIMYSAIITGEPSIDDLKVAIDYAVNKFEILRCRILQDYEGEAYYVMREKRCEPFIEVREYSTSDQEFLTEQERLPFRYDKGEMVRFYIEKYEFRKLKLRIVMHHLGGDGKSALLLVDEIMKNLCALDMGKFDYCEETVVPMQVFTKEYLEEHVQMSDLIKVSAQKVNNNWKKEKVVFDINDYLKMFHEYWKNHKSILRCVKIEEEVFRCVKKLCKENGITIHSFLVAAAERKLNKNDKVAMAVDGKPDDYHRMGNFGGGIAIDCSYDESKTFWENAVYIHNQIHVQLQDRQSSFFGHVMKGMLDCSFQDALTYQSVGYFENALAEDYNNMIGNGKTETKNFLISNIGKFDLASQGYGRFGVDEFVFAPALQSNVDCSVGVATVHDKMLFNVEYNKEDKEYYETVVEGIIQQFNEVAFEDKKTIEVF